MKIVTMHKYIESHLKNVMIEAEKIGSVKLNAYYDGEVYYILDGVHRTEAAKRLGLPLILVSRKWDEMLRTDCENIEARDENGYAPVSAIFEYGYSGEGGIYSDEDFASVEVI